MQNTGPVLNLVSHTGEVFNPPAGHRALRSGFNPLECSVIGDRENGEGGSVRIRLGECQGRYQDVRLFIVWGHVHHTVGLGFTITRYSVAVILRIGARGVLQLV